MPSLPDTAVIILLGLLLFGPKGLAQIARQLGKLMGEFRRASNEFRMQMEEELRISEQTDRQKQIAAVEAAAPVAPALSAASEDMYGEDHPHLPRTTLPSTTGSEAVEATIAAPEPLPIASSGELNIMPPATGLPEPRSSSHSGSSHSESSLSALIDAVPKVDDPSRAVDEAGQNSSADDHEDQRPNRYRDGLNGAQNGTGHPVAAEESLHG